MATVLYRNNEANHESSVSAVGQELLSIKRELCTLRQVMSTVCASTIHQAVSPDVAAPQEPVFANQTPSTSWLLHLGTVVGTRMPYHT